MKTARKIPKLNNIKPEFSLKGYFGKETIEKAAELYEYIGQPVFKRVQTGVNNRSLNWWTAENLLGQNFKTVKRYTFTEFVWIKMIERMRLFTLPLPLIALYREQLFKVLPIKGLVKYINENESFIHELEISPADKKRLLAMLKKEAGAIKDDSQGIGLLELVIVEAIIKRKALSLALFANGELILIDHTQENLYSDTDKRLLETGDYVRVCVSAIVTEFLSSDLAFAVVPKIQLLTYAENKLFEALYTGQYESITVRYADSKQKAVELKKAPDTQKKVLAILRAGGYSEMIVKKNKGVVAKIDQDLKIAF